MDDQDDAPVRIDTPSGYSHGDDLDRIFVDDDERRAWWASPRDFHGVPRRRLRWPPSLGHGVVPRLARAAWALVAVAGVAWAAWSGAKHVLFLGVGAPDFARDPAAVNAAALEAFAGLAEGALVALVIAPTCAALFALVFEAILRALVAVAAPRLPRTLAPSAAKTPAERDRRVADLNAARDIHAAFAALKTAAHSACEARQAAASSAIAAWTRPAVMIVLATASHLAALEASGVPLASALAPGGSLSSARRSRRACGRRGTPARPRRWRRWRPCVAIGARRFDASRGKRARANANFWRRRIGARSRVDGAATRTSRRGNETKPPRIRR